MTVTVGGTVFDHVSYDREADVLYLHKGHPSSAVDFDESPEGHALRFDIDGRLVGITVVNARELLDREGRINVTMPQPQWHLEHGDVAAALGVGG